MITFPKMKVVTWLFFVAVYPTNQLAKLVKHWLGFLWQAVSGMGHKWGTLAAVTSETVFVLFRLFPILNYRFTTSCVWDRKMGHTQRPHRPIWQPKQQPIRAWHGGRSFTWSHYWEKKKISYLCRSAFSFTCCKKNSPNTCKTFWFNAASAIMFLVVPKTIAVKLITLQKWSLKKKKSSHLRFASSVLLLFHFWSDAA